MYNFCIAGYNAAFKDTNISVATACNQVKRWPQSVFSPTSNVMRMREKVFLEGVVCTALMQQI
jgi:hypothetical protein